MSHPRKARLGCSFSGNPRSLLKEGPQKHHIKNRGLFPLPPVTSNTHPEPHILPSLGSVGVTHEFTPHPPTTSNFLILRAPGEQFTRKKRGKKHESPEWENRTGGLRVARTPISSCCLRNILLRQDPSHLCRCLTLGTPHSWP